MDIIVVIGIGAAVAIGVIVFLHYKKSKSVPAAVAATQVDIMGVVSKLTDALHIANKTNAMNATVIASPPVQAVINSGTVAAPAAPTVAPAPAAVPAPPPAPYTQPYVPAPASATGAAAAVQYFDLDGTPNPKGQYDARTLKLAQSQVAQMSTEMATGPLVVASLTSADKAYLMAMGENMTFDPRNLASGPFYSGDVAQLGLDTWPEMNEARHSVPITPFEAQVAPHVVQVVNDLATGTAAWIPVAFAGFGGAAYIAQHQAGWTAGWARLH